jgi:hypothetical protein
MRGADTALWRQTGLPAVIQTFYEEFTQSPSRTFGAGGVLHHSLSKASFRRSLPYNEMDYLR